MKKLVELSIRNPLTFVFLLVIWIVYFIAYVYLHYHGIKVSDQIYISLLISFCFAFLIVVISCINLIFTPGIKNYLEQSSLKKYIDWLDENITLDKVASSKFSVKLMALAAANFLNALICLAVCYNYNLTFRVFIEISLLFILLNFVSNLITILMTKSKKISNP